MNISFVGGTVFIGHAAAKTAVERGHQVTVIHRGEHPAEIDGAESLLADRTQTDALRAALHASAPDAIVDTLAMTAQDARTMIDASRDLDVPMIVLSSQDVYAQFGEICQKVVDGVSQAGIMVFNHKHHDTHAQLIHTIQRRNMRGKLSLPQHT